MFGGPPAHRSLLQEDGFPTPSSVLSTQGFPSFPLRSHPPSLERIQVSPNLTPHSWDPLCHPNPKARVPFHTGSRICRRLFCFARPSLPSCWARGTRDGEGWRQVAASFRDSGSVCSARPSSGAAHVHQLLLLLTLGEAGVSEQRAGGGRSAALLCPRTRVFLVVS